MLLEELSQWSPYPNANDKKFERESLNVVIPQLAALTQSPRAFKVPTSPRDYFGIQTTFNSWPRSSNNISVTHPIVEKNVATEKILNRQENLGKNFMGKRNKIQRSQRELDSYGIRINVLKAFAKNIGYRNFGSHSSISELLDYIIESKLVYRSCKCFQGSKLLQLLIINSNWGDRLDILEQMLKKLISICNDKFGNHVVQCFFQLKDPSVEREIIWRMKRSLCTLAISEYGSKVLQTAILSVNDEVLRIVTNVIVPNALMLAKKNFGHHVLLRSIERGSGALVQMLFAKVIGRRGNSILIELSKDVFGCKIVQKMLENAHPPERVAIIDAIIGSTHDLFALCEDQYGNYVVQHILSLFREKHSMAVMDVLEGKLSKMAKNKFCSNVLEVLYKHGGTDVEDRLIKLVDRDLLKEFLNNKFANYVVRTMLTTGEPENREKLRRLLLKIPHLQKLKYGKFVLKLL